jgi:carboxypeptidase Q
MLEDRIVLKMNESDWAEAMKLPEPKPAAPAPGASGASGAMTPQQFAQLVQRFLVAEGAAVVLDRGSDADLSAGGSDLSWQTQRVDGGTIFPGNGGSRDPKAPQQVPSATLAVEHYNRLVRLLEHGQPVRMEVNIQTKFHPETNPEGNAFNIIAEIPGSDLANEVVIMGAHFDTYPYATGATDNTTGSAAMIEAVRVIQKLGLKPRRTIRLALWAAEEQGLLGSRQYVARHYFDPKTKTPKPEHANVQAYFNLDNGTGRILGIWGQNNTGAMKNFEQWGQALKDLGWRNVSPRSVSQTDHGSFEETGIPGFQFIQERLEYNSRTHHSNMDTFDHVQKDDVIQQGAVAAVFAWYAANAERLPRKPLPAPAK